MPNSIPPNHDRHPMDNWSPDTHITLDTTALMSDCAPNGIKRHLLPWLLAFRKKAVLPVDCYAELRFLATLRDQATAEQVTRAKALIRFLETHNVIEIPTNSKSYVDDLIKRHVKNDSEQAKRQLRQRIERYVDETHFRQLGPRWHAGLLVALVTQSKTRAEAALRGARRTFGPEAPRVVFINEEAGSGFLAGELGCWRERIRRASPNIGGVGPMFSAAMEMAPMDRKRSGAAQLPGSGDRVGVYGGVNGKDKVLTLGAKIAAGGEGTIFQTNSPDLVCKVYLPDNLTQDRLTKLRLMVSHKSPSPFICWPGRLVQNTRGDIVGYLMKNAQGVVLDQALFDGTPAPQFSQWTRRHLVQTAITTLELIKVLHRNNILIGDISGGNFLVRSENEVYQVDTDSMQLGGYPCPMITTEFSPPELLNIRLSNCLRSEGNEAFVVATLVFRILFLGVRPYMALDAGTVVENIANQVFPYTVDITTQQGIRPLGGASLIWSNLSPGLKHAFGAVFKDGQRLPVETWLAHLKSYFDGLCKGAYTNELNPKQRYIRPGEEAMEIACANPSCRKPVTVSRKIFEGLSPYRQQHYLCEPCNEHAIFRRRLAQDRPGPG